MACEHCTPTIQDAWATVRGIVAARESGEVQNASILLREFHKDAQRSGLNSEQGWTTLFTASAVYNHYLLSELAKERGQTFTEALLELAAAGSS